MEQIETRTLRRTDQQQLPEVTPEWHTDALGYFYTLYRAAVDRFDRAQQPGVDESIREELCEHVGAAHRDRAEERKAAIASVGEELTDSLLVGLAATTSARRP